MRLNILKILLLLLLRRIHNRFVSFSIKDNGIGIDQKQLKKIFKKFFRIQNGEIYTAKGFGIGLSFVKKIVKAHGGKIKVDSYPESGAILSLNYLFNKFNYMQQKIKILLAEDDLQLGFIIKDNLKEAGFDVINCPDGETAWEQYQKTNPDLCILDVNMPYRDGYSLAKKIRQKSDLVPILFLTAKSLQEDKLKGFAAGGDDYIVKPFNMKELFPG